MMHLVQRFRTQAFQCAGTREGRYWYPQAFTRYRYRQMALNRMNDMAWGTSVITNCMSCNISMLETKQKMGQRLTI